jgi:magnesium-transporting ATPase (P-type)
MARVKKNRKSELNTTVVSEKTSDQPRSSWKFSFVDYLVVSIFFVIFCYLQKYAAYYWFGVLDKSQTNTYERLALDFFFNTMCIGFVIVAFLTWLHDLVYSDADEEEHDSA